MMSSVAALSVTVLSVSLSAVESAAADERKGVLEPAGGRFGASNQHVHFRLGSIANVVDERDRGLQVVGVAVFAIEEDLQLRRRRLLPAAFRPGRFGPDAASQPHQGGQRRRGPRVDEVAHAAILAGAIVKNS